MTDPVSLSELGIPEVLVDPDTGTEWHLSDPTVELQVQQEPGSGDAGPQTPRQYTYPLTTLRDKLDRGELEPGETEWQDQTEGYPCPVDGCDRELETEAGCKSHVAQVHPDHG